MKWTVLAVLGFLVLGVAMFCRQRGIRYAQSHNIMHTRTDLRLISERVKLAAILEPEKVYSRLSNSLDATNLYKLLSMTNNGVRLLQPRYDWDSAGAALDCWGRPFRIKVEKSRSQSGTTNGGLGFVSVRIWSVGPNGMDERGAGDDISEVFQLNAK